MKFDVYVWNTPFNAWTYTWGYVNAFRKMGYLGKNGDLESWYNPANYQALFDGPSEYVVMLAPEHHRTQIFGTPEKREAIAKLKQQTGKRFLAFIMESLDDPFGARAWAKAGSTWLLDNYPKYLHKGAQSNSTTSLAEHFKCFDHVFAQDEVDVKWLNDNEIKSSWLPSCVDTDMFKPMVERPLNGAAFVGQPHWPRYEFIKLYPFAFELVSMQRAPYNDSTCESTTAALAKAFSSYAIGVNMRSPFAGISTRTFEIMACGSLPIVALPAPDRVLSRKLLAEWGNVFTFFEWSPEDAQKIRSYHCHILANYDQSRQRGLENSKIARDKHTPTCRIQEIISRL
jgi:hypothetical protein